MPGSMWTLECPGCDAAFEIHTGASLCWSCRRGPEERQAVWSFEQMTCQSCGTLVSVQMHDPACRHVRTQRRCRSCRAELVPWAGEVGFTQPDVDHPDFPGIEYVHGPCPRCGTALSPGPGVGCWD